MAGISNLQREIDEYWCGICEKDGRQIWRWKWHASEHKPQRYSRLKTYTDVVEKVDRQWMLKGKDGKADKEIILDIEVPKRFLKEWALKGHQGNDKFIKEWRDGKEGVLREHLRHLVGIVTAHEIRRKQLVESANTEMTAQGDSARWTTDLRVEASWKSSAWILPNVSLADKTTINKAVEIIRRGQDIIFITGAGISTAAGIPDFRSWNGMFRDIGREVFEHSILCSAESLKRHNYAMGLLAQKAMRAKPAASHHMLAYLGEHPNRPLRRHYTQNVDGLETSFRIFPTTVPLRRAYEKLNIQLHGTLRYTTCNVCNETYELCPEDHINNTGLECWNCKRINPEKGIKRRRKIGQVRPDIVLYEQGIDRDIGKRLKVIKKDSQVGKTAADLLVVMGTSAKLPEVHNLVKDISNAVKSRAEGKVIWIGLEPPPGKIFPEFNEVFLIDCETVAQSFFNGVDFEDLH